MDRRNRCLDAAMATASVMQNQLDDHPTAQAAQHSKDLRFQFQRKLQQLLESHAHLDHSDCRCTDRILRAAGGSGDVYEANLWIGEAQIKVALKQMRSYMLKSDNFAKVLCRL